MREARTLSHPLASLSTELFGNAYVLPMAERLLADEGTWTATTLATALQVQGSNKLGGAVARLRNAGLIKSSAGTVEGVGLEILDRAHPFWSFVVALSARG